MKSDRRGLLFPALVVCGLFLPACSDPGHNDNPSQQIGTVPLGCLAASDFFSVYFSLHVQPSGVSPDARISRDMFRSYCDEIPEPGKVFLTIDLVGPELRRMPLGIRIIEAGPGDGDSPVDNGKGMRTIAELPARAYANGLMEWQFELDKTGSYAILLTRAGNAPITAGDTLKIPLHVGVAPAHRSWPAVLAGLFALATSAFLALRFRRRRGWP